MRANADQPMSVAWVYDMDACRGPTGVTRHALALPAIELQDA